MANKVKDLRRKRFGKLVAIKRKYDEEKKQSMWYCLCNCGNEALVSRKHLISGATQSCGCLAREKTSKRSWKGFGDISGKYWGDLSRSAKYRDVDFNITIEEAWDIFVKQKGRCKFTGEKLFFQERKKKQKSMQTASLDRVDNTKGYTVDNCAWVHKRVNKLKNDFTTEELIYWSNKIVEHFNRKD